MARAKRNALKLIYSNKDYISKTDLLLLVQSLSENEDERAYLNEDILYPLLNEEAEQVSNILGYPVEVVKNKVKQQTFTRVELKLIVQTLLYRALQEGKQESQRDAYNDEL